MLLHATDNEPYLHMNIFNFYPCLNATSFISTILIIVALVVPVVLGNTSTRLQHKGCNILFQSVSSMIKCSKRLFQRVTGMFERSKVILQRGS